MTPKKGSTVIVPAFVFDSIDSCAENVRRSSGGRLAVDQRGYVPVPVLLREGYRTTVTTSDIVILPPLNLPFLLEGTGVLVDDSSGDLLEITEGLTRSHSDFPDPFTRCLSVREGVLRERVSDMEVGGIGWSGAWLGDLRERVV